MSAYIEVPVQGGRRALIEAGSIAGVITSPGASLDNPGVTDAPVAIMLRGGQTIEVVGQSGLLIMARAKIARKKVRDEGSDWHVDFLDGGDGTQVQEPMG